MDHTPIRNKFLSKVTENVIKIPPSPMMIKLGYGTGVTVYKMERSPVSNKIRSPWAIKKIGRNIRNKKLINARLVDEASILCKLNHPNIVGFRACIKNENGTSVLAMEGLTMSLGDLICERLDNDLDKFPPNDIYKVALDVLKALEYLHTKALILHCDIKSYNILLDAGFTICKVGDFGVSLPLNTDGTVAESESDDILEYPGTPGWCSPEVLQLVPIITIKADIYAFGLVIWEMLALTPPPLSNNDKSVITIDSSDSEADDSNDFSLQSEISEARLRPFLPNTDFSEEYDYVLELFYCCTEADFTKRPDSTDLLCNVQNIIDCVDKEKK